MEVCEFAGLSAGSHLPGKFSPNGIGNNVQSLLLSVSRAGEFHLQSGDCITCQGLRPPRLNDQGSSVEVINAIRDYGKG